MRSNVVFRLGLGIVIAFLFSANAGAQVPTCTGASANLIYSITNAGSIVNYNPALPVSTTNPGPNALPSPPVGSYGLTVSSNLAGVGPNPTFYVVAGSQMHYYNGTTWVNTGHSSGYMGSMPNAAGGGGYIYILDYLNGDVYRYGGTGPATYLTTVAGYSTSAGGAHTLATDCSGNWYAFISGGLLGGGYLRKYSPAGLLLQTWNLVGTVGPTFEGITILGNDVYGFGVNAFVYKGVITGSTINFTMLPGQPPLSFHNFTACPSATGSSVVASIDTGYYCGSGPGVPVSVTGTAPFTWSVISGPAFLSSTTGSNITVTATGVAKIRVEGSPNPCGISSTDTVTIIVPTAAVDAGPNSTVSGCGSYRDTLAGTLAGTVAGITYNIAWSPSASIVSGANTLSPVVVPSSNTTYTFTVSTPAMQGGCVFSDTTRVTVQDIGVSAGFNHTIAYGCSRDTVAFINSSTSFGGAITYHWDFGDGTTSAQKDPVHIYAIQGTYAVKMVARNAACADSLIISLPLEHTLDAAFISSADSLCQGDTVFFANNSVATTSNGIAPSYFWNFGDGTTDTAREPKHYYNAGGVYVVTLTVRDFVPCLDSARDTIVVDSPSQVHILVADTSICQGQAASFSAQFLSMGNTGLSWTFGDGTGDYGDSVHVAHGYDEPGIYNVVLAATYRQCRDTADTVQLVVRPFPSLNVGTDTSICPNGEPIQLTARLSGAVGIPSSTLVTWSTGDTASSILVRHHGEYWARATSNGCSVADTVEVAKNCYLDIPNVFTPNGDGINDYFWPRQLLSAGIVRFSMSLYNRWGQKIWETSNIDGRGWDGGLNGVDQPAGVFIYLLEAELKNGYREKYQGSVTLLR